MNTKNSLGRVALCLLLAPGLSLAADEPLDFDPALLLEETPATAPAAQPARPATPRPATPARVQPAPSARAAAPASRPVDVERTARMPAASERLAPLEGELREYVAQSTVAWQLRAGETLRTALTRWTQEAGWTLVWKASRDYRIEAGLNLPSGTPFVDAVKSVVRAVWRANPTLHATTYTNAVLVIEDGKEAAQ